MKEMTVITIYRGEDTDFADAPPIPVTFTTDLDVTGFTAEIYFGSVVKTFTSEEVQTKTLGLVYSAAETSSFFPGKGWATLKLYDTKGKVRIQERFVIDVKFRYGEAKDTENETSEG
jgi:hypothetical protein